MSSQNLVGNNVTGRTSVLTPVLKSTADGTAICVDSDLVCKFNEVVNGNLTVNGNISSNSPANAVELSVPTKFNTINDALTYAFSSTDNHRFRIVLETQGPHMLTPKKICI
jgi:hypothetical protein